MFRELMFKPYIAYYRYYRGIDVSLHNILDCNFVRWLLFLSPICYKSYFCLLYILTESRKVVWCEKYSDMVEVYAVDFNLEKVKHYIFTLCLCFVYKINNIFMLTIIFLLTYIYINIYLDIFGPFNVIE